jgi:RHS repeat-associated protein
MFMKEGTQHYFYHNDHLGTPHKMTSVSGAVVWSAKYESFGKAVIDPGSTVVNNLRFPGQYFDAETGLHYNYHRYYDPMTSRYLMSDPIKYHSQPLGEYTYAQANPLSFIDPEGFYCKQTTAWKEVPTFEDPNKTPQKLYSSSKRRWDKIREWSFVVIPGKTDVAEIGCCCLWELAGYVRKTVFIRERVIEADFRCGIDECPKREWTERRTKFVERKVEVEEPEPAIFKKRKAITCGQITEGGCTCHEPY